MEGRDIKGTNLYFIYEKNQKEGRGLIRESLNEFHTLIWSKIAVIKLYERGKEYGKNIKKSINNRCNIYNGI